MQQLVEKLIFEELAKYRQKLGLPPAGSEDDRTTIAKLEMGGGVFFGISAGSNPNRTKITLKVNPISRTHAEADAFQQAFDAQLRGGRARLTVDRDLCRACGQNGGVKGMARQLGIEEIEVSRSCLKFQELYKINGFLLLVWGKRSPFLQKQLFRTHKRSCCRSIAMIAFLN